MKKIRFFYMASMYILLFALASGSAFAAEKTYTNSIGMEFILVPAGTFMMGCDEYIYECGKDTNQVQVTISKPFYLGKYEVTNAQWKSLMGSLPSTTTGDRHPVNNVGRDKIMGFVRALNKKEGVRKYRLPTEAEWEYAYRAGTKTMTPWGDNINVLQNYGWAWYDYRKGLSVHPVGQLKPNPWGFYDMCGNVGEWVEGRRSGLEKYPNGPLVDPQGSSSGEYQSVRGGNFDQHYQECISYYRSFDGEHPVRMPRYGFRLVMTVE